MPNVPEHSVRAVRTHLAMHDISALRPARVPGLAATIQQEQANPGEYRALYAAVGHDWHWHDRLVLPDDELTAYFASPSVQLWVVRVRAEVAGYFELKRHDDARVEIVYFGLLPAFFGRGLGGWMLTRAIEQAFAMGADLVTLHTCTLDSPHALPNYLARGFVITREEEYEVES
jgi:ribosomal protein S18 acetylase RimI-like enzyme